MLRNFSKSFKKNIYAGALIALPVFGTIWFISWLINFFDSMASRVLPDDLRWLNETLDYPGAGVIATLIFLSVLGVIGRTFLGSKIVALSGSVLARVPLIGAVYATGQKIVRAIVPNKNSDLRKVALLEYPSPGMWCICFVTGDAPDKVSEALSKTIKDQAVSVFIPTAPNPTSGMLLMVPVSRLQILDMPADEGMRFIITAGISESKVLR